MFSPDLSGGATDGDYHADVSAARRRWIAAELSRPVRLEGWVGDSTQERLFQCVAFRTLPTRNAQA